MPKATPITRRTALDALEVLSHWPTPNGAECLGCDNPPAVGAHKPGCPVVALQNKLARR